MKEQFRPLELPHPQVGHRRISKRVIETPPPEAREARLQKLRFTLDLITQVREKVRRLSHEERKAMFYRIRHDRPLRLDDLRGTGFNFMGAPGAMESLIVPKREDSLDKLESRVREYGESNEAEAIKRTANLVEATKELSLGAPEDRFSESFAAAYPDLLSKDFCIVELEICSFATQHGTKQRELHEFVRDLKRTIGVSGNVYDIDYDEASAMVVLSCSGVILRKLVEEPIWRRKIVVFDVRPRFKTLVESYKNFNIDRVSIEAPPEDAETICVIDTGVAAGNPFLAKVIRRDLSRSYITGYDATVDEDGHGSGVASLAAFYAIDDTDGGVNRPRAWIASARIIDEKGELDVVTKDENGQYWVEGGKLLSTLLRRIVEDMVADGVRIFVLSFVLDRIWCQASKRVVPRSLWLARSIDRLCRNHPIVFTTITGNILSGDVEALHREAQYPNYFESPAAKICDPGQAALAVTVGSMAQSARVLSANLAPMVLAGKPSPFTRSGPGFLDCVKPDFVERGGNLVIDGESGLVSNTHLATNVIMASAQQSPPLTHRWGTSFAAPRVAFHAAVIAYDLRRIGVLPSPELIRAFLAISSTISPEMTAFQNEELDRHLHGYGLPNGERATDCESYAISTFYQGMVEPGHVMMFRVHVPGVLAQFGRGEKRITVCTAMAPPVQSVGLEKYLGAEMEFRVFRGDAPPEKVEAWMCEIAESGLEVANRSELAKTLQKSNIEGRPNLTKRSVGSLQKGAFVWHDHKTEYSEHDYIVAVSLRPASWWKDESRQLRFACVVRVEDLTEQCVELYSQVQARVRLRT